MECWFDPSRSIQKERKLSKKTLQFKIKVQKENQDYEYISEFRVIGYWKMKGDWFWKSLGQIAHVESASGYGSNRVGPSGGIWKDHYYSKFLEKCKEEFFRRQAAGVPMNKSKNLLEVDVYES